MKHEDIVELIKEVSQSNLAAFSYEEGDVKLSFKKKEKETVVMSAAAQTEEKPENVNAKAEGTVVSSPLVGTFYASAEEAGESFVRVGESVKKGQTIAIVEAMKLMNEIEAECDGVVEEIYVENGQTVEYGQPLFRIAG